MDYKPASTHPWKTSYKVNLSATVVQREVPSKTLKDFMIELAESWNEVEIVTTVSGTYGRYVLSQLPQRKQAAWLVGILRRNYE